MNKKNAYNILTQLLSDLQDTGNYDMKELQEYQAAINALYGGKR